MVAGLVGFPLGFLLVVLTVALGFGPGTPLGALLLLGSTLLLTFLALRWLARRLFYGVGRRLLKAARHLDRRGVERERALEAYRLVAEGSSHFAEAQKRIARLGG